MTKLNVGVIRIRIRQPDIGGLGFSASSNETVLRVALRFYLVNGRIPTPEELAKEALKFERRMANGRAVAANEVYPIVFGGIQLLHSYLVRVMPEPVLGAEEWLGQYLCMAFNPNGGRQIAKAVPEKLFQNQKAGRCYVREISRFAEASGSALKRHDLLNLGHGMNEFRRTFDQWTDGVYTSRTKAMIRKLEKAVPSGIIAWKPPGAGGCESLTILSPNQEARDAVIQHLRKLGWWAAPVSVTGGFSMEISPRNAVRVTAGYRLDLIGAADLGQDATIRQSGCCLSLAIEPRAEMILDRDSGFSPMLYKLPPDSPHPPHLTSAHSCQCVS